MEWRTYEQGQITAIVATGNEFFSIRRERSFGTLLAVIRPDNMTDKEAIQKAITKEIENNE